MASIHRYSGPYDSGIRRQDYGIIRGFIGHSGIFRQDYGIVRGLPMNYTRTPSGSLVTETGEHNYHVGPDCVAQA